MFKAQGLLRTQPAVGLSTQASRSGEVHPSSQFWAKMRRDRDSQGHRVSICEDDTVDKMASWCRTEDSGTLLEHITNMDDGVACDLCFNMKRDVKRGCISGFSCQVRTRDPHTPHEYCCRKEQPSAAQG